MPRRPIAFAVISFVGFGMLLTGCSSPVALQAAPDANNPLCADVSVRLPTQVAGQERRWTDAQATGAWGEKASVILSCGVKPPGPTEEKCVTVAGVDWIVDDSNAPDAYVTTYGRTPAVLVYYNNEVVSGVDVLDALATSVSTLPVSGECTSTKTLLPQL